MTVRDFVVELVRIVNVHGVDSQETLQFIVQHAPDWEAIELARLTILLKKALSPR